MQTVNSQVYGGALTGFNNLLFHLFAHLGHYLLNTCWVNTSVGNQLVQCQAGNFAAYRVEGREYNRFRRIIHHDFHTGCRFKGTNITSFTTDDTSLNFVAFDMEHRHWIFDSCFSGYTLYALNYNTFCLLAGRQFGIIHDIIDVALSLRFSLLL